MAESISTAGRAVVAGSRFSYPPVRLRMTSKRSGLSPENVREAIERVRPWAVDASSSLEKGPGIKDHDRVRAYVEAARC